jgi:hypothetical protein
MLNDSIDDAATATLKNLLLDHVSLGVNCEFGMVQRYCRVEPLDLLRFALTPLEGLIGQLRTGFAAFADSRNLSIEPDDTGWEYIARERVSDIGLHTNVLVQDQPVAAIHPREAQRIGRLARKLLTELSTGRRTTVFSRGGLVKTDVWRLHDALLVHGPVRLLAVTAAPSPNMAGSVVKLRDGLAIGYVDRVTPTGYAADPSLDLWLAILRLSARMLADPAILCGVPATAAPDDHALPADVVKPLLWNARAARRRGDIDSALSAYRLHVRAFPDDRVATREWGALRLVEHEPADSG